MPLELFLDVGGSPENLDAHRDDAFIGNPTTLRRPAPERLAQLRVFSWPNGLLRRGRYRIEFALALLDPARADMALYRNADMVRTIASTCRV
jgi:hypothetical protein